MKLPENGGHTIINYERFWIMAAQGDTADLFVQDSLIVVYGVSDFYSPSS